MSCAALSLPAGSRSETGTGRLARRSTIRGPRSPRMSSTPRGRARSSPTSWEPRCGHTSPNHSASPFPASALKSFRPSAWFDPRSVVVRVVLLGVALASLLMSAAIPNGFHGPCRCVCRRLRGAAGRSKPRRDAVAAPRRATAAPVRAGRGVELRVGDPADSRGARGQLSPVCVVGSGACSRPGRSVGGVPYPRGSAAREPRTGMLRAVAESAAAARGDSGPVDHTCVVISGVAKGGLGIGGHANASA